MESVDVDAIFGRRVELPDSDFDSRLARLVGMEDSIARLCRMLEILLFPAKFAAWRKKHHPQASALFDFVKHRPPLVILAGDVGVGKTELSETIGSRVARKNKMELTLFPLSLSSRGSGLVGEMTKLITAAFDHVNSVCEKIGKTKDGSHKSGVVMLIDEADALAQSRNAGQMHHEDKAGVNALIRGIDTLNRRQHPVAVMMCTNRLAAMDPAVVRRAAEVFVFERPNKEKRLALLRPSLSEIGFSPSQIDEIVNLTGETQVRKYGFTYSDITQKFFHALILSAFPGKAITHDDALSTLKSIHPTPPFKDA
jgi:AAA+ superfamily predicted ATPase